MKKALILLAATTIGLGTMNAWAVDLRTQPGMNCAQIPDGSGLPHGAPYIDGWGALENTSSSQTMATYCPIVRDNESAAPSAMTVDFSMNNNNYHSAACQFVTLSVTGGGASQLWGPANYVTPLCNYPNPCQVTFSAAGLNYIGGTEFIECVVPPTTSYGTSSIFGYSVQE
jgi:hypothetical protein